MLAYSLKGARSDASPALGASVPMATPCRGDAVVIVTSPNECARLHGGHAEAEGAQNQPYAPEGAEPNGASRLNDPCFSVRNEL